MQLASVTLIATATLVSCTESVSQGHLDHNLRNVDHAQYILNTRQPNSLEDLWIKILMVRLCSSGGQVDQDRIPDIVRSRIFDHTQVNMKISRLECARVRLRDGKVLEYSFEYGTWKSPK